MDERCMIMDIQLGVVEARFADIIWSNEPVTSSELVKKAKEELGWARTTTHTVVRRLCDKGLFVNESGMVRAIISRDDFYSQQCKQYIEDTFDGSLPKFLAAFTRGKKLSPEEADEIRRMIDNM